MSVKRHVLRKKCSKNVLCHEEKKSFFKSQTKKIEGKKYWIKNFLGKKLSIKRKYVEKNICKNDI